MKTAVVLLSGGIDSTTLLHHAKHTLNFDSIHALSFDYGQKHSCELEMARWQANHASVTEHKCIDLQSLKQIIGPGSALTDDSVDVPNLSDLSDDDHDQPPTYVPNRNMILLALSAAYAEARNISDVFYGAQAQDEYGYWDCTTDYVSRLNHTLALNRRVPINVHAPFIAMKKSDILKIGIALNIDYSHTWSCYRGQRPPCGSCPTCSERSNAFADISLADPLL